jgi:hypothetical protein
VLDPSLPAVEVIPETDSITTAAERRLGAFRRVEAVDPIMTGPRRPPATCARAASGGATLCASGGSEGACCRSIPMRRPCCRHLSFPRTTGRWVHIEPFTARVTRLEFDRDAKGAVTTMRLGGDAAPARRGRMRPIAQRIWVRRTVWRPRLVLDAHEIDAGRRVVSIARPSRPRERVLAGVETAVREGGHRASRDVEHRGLHMTGARDREPQ